MENIIEKSENRGGSKSRIFITAGEQSVTCGKRKIKSAEWKIGKAKTEIFITAGERSVTCGKKAILLGIFTLIFGAISLNAQTYNIGTPTANAVTAVLSGSGTNKTLTISGSGAMLNFTSSTIPWNSEKSNIKTVIISSLINNIGNYAFFGCTNLATADISDIDIIGEHAFDDCTNLTLATLPFGLTSIGNGAFQNCSNLSGSINMPNTVTFIGEYAFDGCSSLTGSLHIPSPLTGNYTFRGCSGLTSLTFGNSVTSIPLGTFSGCSGLTSVTIPNSVNFIGTTAFYGCTDLTSINIPNSVTSISANAFWGCTGLTSVSISTSLPSISNGVFMNCSALNSVIIPNSVTSIGTNAFYGCSALDYVVIPNTVTAIKKNAFADCTGLNSIIAANPSPIISPNMGADVFLNVNKNTCILYVPNGTIPLYDAAPQWTDFINIQEIPLAGISDISKKSVNVYPNPTFGELRITNYQLRDNAEISIFDMNGRNVGANSIRPIINGNETKLDISNLPQGTYLLKINNETVKVIKK